MTFTQTFILILSFVLKFEGGFTTLLDDPGGATNKGVTQATYNAYLKSKHLPKKSVKFITKDEVNEVYYDRYFLKCYADSFEFPLALVHMDAAVNFGVSKSLTLMKRTLGYKETTSIKEVFKNVKGMNQDSLARIYIDERIKERYKIVERIPTSKRFLRGWINRDKKLIKIIDDYKNKK